MYGSNQTHGTVEQHLRIDSFDLLQRLELGKKRLIILRSSSSVTVQLVNDAVLVEYMAGGLQQQTVRLSRVNNGFGGKPRVFFLCPRCGRRVRMLYHADGRFRCRKCATLNYRSQQVSNRKAASLRIERTMREDFGIKEYHPQMQYMLPDRPKYMHQSTYEQRIAKLKRIQDKVFGE